MIRRDVKWSWLPLSRWLATTLIVAAQSIAQAISAEPKLSDKHEVVSNTVQVGDLPRVYLVHVPPAYRRGAPSPLLLAFHGGGGRADHMNRLTGLNAFSDKENFIVVYPSGLEKHWHDGRTDPANVDDVSFVNAMLDKLCQDYDIDKKRIYACGISNGGFFSQFLAINLSGRIAAVASVAASSRLPVFEGVVPPHPVPVLFVLGKKDPLVPFAGGEIKIGMIKRGKVASADQAIQYWVKANRCDSQPVVEALPDSDPPDGTHITKRQYSAGPHGAPVVAYIIENGGHTWPGGWQYLPERYIGKTSRAIDANQVIWQFFQTQALTSSDRTE